MDKNKLRKSIKNDILKNLDCIVDSIYDSMEVNGELDSPTQEDIVDVIKIIRDTEVEQDKKNLDYYLGKQDMPPPIIKEDGSVEVYTEIDMDDICEKIKIANSVFTHLYRYRYRKGNTPITIPEEIKEILGVYELSLMYDKQGKASKRDATRKWLMGVALIGIVRFRGLANSPYMLDDDIEESIKLFFKGLKDLYSVFSGKKIMIDPTDAGFCLWDVRKDDTPNSLRFRKKPK